MIDQWRLVRQRRDVERYARRLRRLREGGREVDFLKLEEGGRWEEVEQLVVLGPRLEADPGEGWLRAERWPGVGGLVVEVECPKKGWTRMGREACVVEQRTGCGKRCVVGQRALHDQEVHLGHLAVEEQRLEAREANERRWYEKWGRRVYERKKAKVKGERLRTKRAARAAEVQAERDKAERAGAKVARKLQDEAVVAVLEEFVAVRLVRRGLEGRKRAGSVDPGAASSSS